jgi:hypothetical protein
MSIPIATPTEILLPSNYNANYSRPRKCDARLDPRLALVLIPQPPGHLKRPRFH